MSEISYICESAVWPAQLYPQWHRYVCPGSHLFTPVMDTAMLAEVCNVDVTQYATQDSALHTDQYIWSGNVFLVETFISAQSNQDVRVKISYHGNLSYKLISAVFWLKGKTYSSTKDTVK